MYRYVGEYTVLTLHVFPGVSSFKASEGNSQVPFSFYKGPIIPVIILFVARCLVFLADGLTFNDISYV